LLTAAALSLIAAFLLRFEFTLQPPERRLLALGLCLFLPLRASRSSPSVCTEAGGA